MADIEVIRRGLSEAYALYRARLLKTKQRPSILGGPSPTDAELIPLVDALRDARSFQKIDGWWIWAKGQQNVVSATWLAKWAFPHWEIDPDLSTVSEKIFRVINAREEPITLFTAVWGALVNGTHTLDTSTMLRNFADLKNERGEHFGGHMLSNPMRFLGGYQSAVIGDPTLAIKKEAPNFPFLADDPRLQSQTAQDLISQSELACLSLVAFGTCSSIVDLSWFEYNERILDDVWYEETRFWRMPEVVPNATTAITVDLQDFLDCHRMFSVLPAARRDHYESSLKRFELSLARRNLADQAIDLCTAFEQLLGSGGNGPISWSNGLRCAALIGGDRKTRRKTRDIVQSLYKLRNISVHGGHLESMIKTTTMNKIHCEELMLLAKEAYSALMKALIALKEDPDWFELETAGTL